MDADRFIVYIKTEEIYIEIAKDVKARFDIIFYFDTSNYELGRSLPKHRYQLLKK